jgi:hypothetical protein
MTHVRRSQRVALAVLASVALLAAPAGAADKSKVDRATKRVDQGAKAIGHGQVGSGFREMFTGIGLTIYEGARYSGQNIKEFFQGRK